MAENKKKMIRVTFTGKELLGGAVFDTTDENTAKNAGIFDQGRKYSPLTIITGENELLPLVEKELERMKEGEEKLLKLLSKDAFGERQSDLVRVVPLQNFHDQKINPYPGLVLRIGKALGKIQSVGSGRVRIDFNHPLAGRDVEYNIKHEKEFKDKKEVSEQIFEKYFSIIPGSKKEIKEDELTITLEGNAFKNLTKITEAVKRLALEFGIKAEF
ncbi:MAG: FKBP-type peptidyl-prolyl cis-trans isomerase, partial [Candidatus Diapherotrites archaeon]|nr:FKBP-type peptidyl-prolyl cis-trans isomerase [Candidatus Diapherotrites archaeon]